MSSGLDSAGKFSNILFTACQILNKGKRASPNKDDPTTPQQIFRLVSFSLMLRCMISLFTMISKTLKFMATINPTFRDVEMTTSHPNLDSRACLNKKW